MIDIENIEETSAEVKRLNAEYIAQRNKTLETADELIKAYRRYVVLLASAITDIAEEETEKTPI